MVEGLSGGLCPFNCTYCGDARPPTTRRRRLADSRPLFALMDDAMGRAGSLDHVVVGGDGDPLLWTGCGDFLRRVGARYEVPLVVLTPGPLLSRCTIRSSLEPASVVIAKLDAGTSRIMQSVNRPHRGVRLDRLGESLDQFRRGFRGGLWVHVRLIEGLNDGSGEAARAATILRRIGPARVVVVGPAGVDSGSTWPGISLGGIVVMRAPKEPFASGLFAADAHVSGGESPRRSCWAV